LSEAVRNTKRVERSTDRNLPTMSTTFAVKVESPRRCGYLLFFMEIRNIMCTKPEMELIVITAPMENIFNAKYLENSERHSVRLRAGPIWNNPWTIDWHYDLWLWM